MARMMDVFDAEFLDYQRKCEAMELTVDVECKKYPPRVVLGQEISLFENGEQECKTIIYGGLEPEIAVKGTLEVTKKQLNDLVKGAVNLLEIYLHAYMQDHVEYERAMKERSAE